MEGSNGKGNHETAPRDEEQWNWHKYGVSKRQAENLSDFADRRRESRQYEKLGRAVAKKVLYLLGALGLYVWSLVDGRVTKLIEWVWK